MAVTIEHRNALDPHTFPGSVAELPTTAEFHNSTTYHRTLAGVPASFKDWRYVGLWGAKLHYPCSPDDEAMDETNRAELTHMLNVAELNEPDWDGDNWEIVDDNLWIVAGSIAASEYAHVMDRLADYPLLDDIEYHKREYEYGLNVLRDDLRYEPYVESDADIDSIQAVLLRQGHYPTWGGVDPCYVDRAILKLATVRAFSNNPTWMAPREYEGT